MQNSSKTSNLYIKLVPDKLGIFLFATGLFFSKEINLVIVKTRNSSFDANVSINNLHPAVSKPTSFFFFFNSLIKKDCSSNFIVFR